MANPNRTDYEGPPLSGPGILWINSKVTDPAHLPVEAFNRWYEEVHIPDIIGAKPGGVLASWRYKCGDSDRPAPFLAVYKVPDMGFLQSKEFKSIPMVHPTLPGHGPIHRFADFDARFLAHVETWKSDKALDERTSMLISEAIEPVEGMTDNFNDWYRSNYITAISKFPGWRRTSRFRLVFKKENKDDSGGTEKTTPTLLTLHEFQADSMLATQKIASMLQELEGVKKVGLNPQMVDIAPFELFWGFGDTRRRCQRNGKSCVIRDDDDRKRPLTKAHVKSLLRRIDTLENTISGAGIQVPPDTDPSLQTRCPGTGSMSQAPSSGLCQPRHPASTDSSTVNSDMDSSSSRFVQERLSVQHTGESGIESLANPESITTRLRRDSRSSSHRVRIGNRSSFFGITTNYHIYSDVYRTELFAISEAQNEQAQEFLANIPADTHAYLMDRFWKCYNLVIHVVHKEAFEADCLNNGDRYYSIFLHMCILGIGYRGSVLHQEAKRLVEHELKMPGGLPSIQALILLGDLECAIGNYNTGWLYAGMASRLCFDLGLNQDSAEPDLLRLDVEVRKTVLWACVTIDRYWGLFLGRRTSIKWTDLSPTAKDQPMHDCYPMGHQRGLETYPSAFYLAAGLDLELRDWYNRLPDRLKWSTDKLDTAPSSYFILHQQYHTLFILLYRPFIPELIAGAAQHNQEPVSDIILPVARSACFSHATEVARTMGAYRQRFDMKSMFVTGMQHAATAALALVESMPTIARKSQSDTLAYLQCLAEVLHANAITYFPAKVMSEILFTVIGEYRTSQTQANSAPQNVAQMSKPSSQVAASFDIFESGQTHRTIGNDATDVFGDCTGSGVRQVGIPRDAPYPIIPSRFDVVGQQWPNAQSQVEPLMEDALHNDNVGFDSEIWKGIMDILSQPLEY
ncbi:Fc.00g032980.m01.CDS01 [Cosmosporella sp. VM-42]